MPDFDVAKEALRLKKAKAKKVKRLPLPSPGDVLYAPPNKGGGPKQCGNCWMWRQDDGCVIVDGELLEAYSCGYHVEGTPAGDEVGDVAAQKVSQELAGVTHEPTSCSSCTYFDPGLSRCRAVAVDGKPALVAPMGCCTRWTKR